MSSYFCVTDYKDLINTQTFFFFSFLEDVSIIYDNLFFYCRLAFVPSCPCQVIYGLTVCLCPVSMLGNNNFFNNLFFLQFVRVQFGFGPPDDKCIAKNIDFVHLLLSY